jgi:hypothetical protein
MADFDISAERLRQLLHYDHETGIFTWKVSIKARTYPGKIAGCKDTYGYIKICIDQNQCRAHRLAWLYMTGEWPAHSIDHIDGDKSNNAWSNLRIAIHSDNISNQKLSAANTIGYKGIHLHSSGKWRAQISAKKKKIHLGYFATKQDAHAAYCRAAGVLHGEFARFK